MPVRVKSVDVDKNYTLGRGELSFNGRYLGNSSLLQVCAAEKNHPACVRFNLDEITLENLKFFYNSFVDETLGAIRFKAHNPTGQNVDYDFPKVGVRAKRVELKGNGENWQSLEFCATIYPDKNGIWLTFTFPQTHALGEME